ncbi:hypothetical protein [Pyxidicoccus fallax]|nr:hypothetical protein [Pyxidicoccus fallax]
MEQHRRILGILFIVTSALTLLLGLGFGAFMALMGNLSYPHGTGDEDGRMSLFLVAAGVAGCTFLLGLPGIITGVGLLKRQRWSKTLALVLGILSLPSFPLGTVLGIYALWFYSQPGSNLVFE